MKSIKFGLMTLAIMLSVGAAIATNHKQSTDVYRGLSYDAVNDRYYVATPLVLNPNPSDYTCESPTSNICTVTVAQGTIPSTDGSGGRYFSNAQEISHANGTFTE